MHWLTGAVTSLLCPRWAYLASACMFVPSTASVSCVTNAHVAFRLVLSLGFNKFLALPARSSGHRDETSFWSGRLFPHLITFITPEEEKKQGGERRMEESLSGIEKQMHTFDFPYMNFRVALVCWWTNANRMWMQKRIYVCLCVFFLNVFVPYFRPEMCEWGRMITMSNPECQC